MKRCRQCGDPVGKRSTAFCDYHRGYHTGHAVASMAAKRAANPAYRERERKAVRIRMRKLRAKRAESAAHAGG